MSMWRTVVVAIVAVGLTVAAGAQSTFTLKVHTGKGQIGYDVNSTMIIGERDIVLIDPQFSLSEAHKLAAEILETGKHLATIYSTHAHPANWSKTIDQIAALKPAIVVPGHEGPSATRDMAVNRLDEEVHGRLGMRTCRSRRMPRRCARTY